MSCGATCTERNIGSEVYYPVPLHLQACFRGYGYEAGCLPDTERAAEEVLSLPVFPQMTEQEQDAVVEQISRFYRQRSPVVPALLSTHLAARDLTTS